MEFVRFAFSSFWVWCGILILVYETCEGIAKIIEACRRKRTVKVYYAGDFRAVEIAGATDEDVRNALDGEDDSVEQ